ncbi:hypothetical protein [Jannaschia rubra]|uniref:hypothetical protein n=1 Tax=Jannaschia rubra TaxID=282197 RepID=UPI001F3E69C1|nr:hypothetical protein [Jannaschia rubra]
MRTFRHPATAFGLALALAGGASAQELRIGLQSDADVLDPISRAPSWARSCLPGFATS